MVALLDGLRSNRRTVAIVAVSLCALLLAYYFVPVDWMKEKVTAFNIWVESLGVMGPIVLAIVDAAAIVVCFPFTLGFELAAGFLFGLLPGICIIAIAKVSGACIAFMMARTVLKSWVERMLATNERFSAVYGAMKVDSFRLAVLLRLAPFPPSWVNNYALAVSPISFYDFMLATALASLPTIAVNVYMGSFMGSLTTAVADAKSGYNWIQYFFSALGLVAVIFASKYIMRYIQAALSAKPKGDLEAQNI